MRYLKRFNESKTFITDIDEIREICNGLNLVGFQIRNDGTVDIVGHHETRLDFTFINARREYEGKKLVCQGSLPIKFGSVDAGFVYGSRYSKDKRLTTLEGSPDSCGYYYITDMDITTLEGSPKFVETAFYISNCDKLTSLKGSPTHMNGLFSISNCPITSLEGCPKIINDSFACIHTNIKDFKGGPDKVEGDLNASGTPITSLEGLPEHIGSLHINSQHIWDPTPLRDIIIMDSFACPQTPLTHLLQFFFNLHDMPEQDDVYYTDLDAYTRFIESLDYKWLKGDEKNPKIDLFRLQEALNEFDINVMDFLEDHDEWIDSIGPYTYIDSRGERVNIFGEKL